MGSRNARTSKFGSPESMPRYFVCTSQASSGNGGIVCSIGSPAGSKNGFGMCLNKECTGKVHVQVREVHGIPKGAGGVRAGTKKQAKQCTSHKTRDIRAGTSRTMQCTKHITQLTKAGGWWLCARAVQHRGATRRKSLRCTQR